MRLCVVRAFGGRRVRVRGCRGLCDDESEL